MLETIPSTAEIIVKAICILHNTILDLEELDTHIRKEGEKFINNKPKNILESSKKSNNQRHFSQLCLQP